MYASKAELFEPRLPEDDLELAIGTVRVRALSRREAIRLEDCTDEASKQATIIAWGLVDPVLTVAEVMRWMDATPAGELQPVGTRIAELSGLLEDAPKAAYKSDGDEPDAGV